MCVARGRGEALMAGIFGFFLPSMTAWNGLTVDELSLWAERVEHVNDLWAWYDAPARGG